MWSLPVDRGWLGLLVFVVTMWILQPSFSGACLYGPGVAGLVGAGGDRPVVDRQHGGSFIAFAFARWVARDWAQQRLTDRLRAWDSRVAQGGVREVAVLRLFTGQVTPADWLLGVSSVRLTPFFLGTAIGIIPSVVLVVLVGASVGNWLFAEPSRWGVALVAIAIVGLLRRIRRRGNPATAGYSAP